MEVTYCSEERAIDVLFESKGDLNVAFETIELLRMTEDELSIICSRPIPSQVQVEVDTMRVGGSEVYEWCSLVYEGVCKLNALSEVCAENYL